MLVLRRGEKTVGEIRVTVSAVVKSDTYMLICAYMMHVNIILSLCWKHLCASFICEVYVVITFEIQCLLIQE